MRARVLKKGDGCSRYACAKQNLQILDLDPEPGSVRKEGGRNTPQQVLGGKSLCKDL
jgi:hypothetical protein